MLLDQDLLRRITREALRARSPELLLGAEDASYLAQYWTSSIVQNLGEAVEALCDGHRGEAAGFLSLAWTFAIQLQAAKEQVYWTIGERGRKSLPHDHHAMIRREKMGGRYLSPFDHILEEVSGACSRFSLADNNCFLGHVNRAMVTANWLAAYVERFSMKN